MKKRSVILALAALMLAVVLLMSACGSGKSSTQSPMPSNIPTPAQTPPVPMNNYADANFGYSINYPLEWKAEHPVVNQFRAASQGMISGNSEFGNNESGIVVTIDNSTYPQDLTLETYYLSFLASAKKSSGITNLTEQSAGQLVFGQHISGYASTWLVTDSASQWKMRWYFANARNQFYVICVYSIQSAFEKYSPVFDAAIDSFTFINSTNTAAKTSAAIPTSTKSPYSSPPPMTIDKGKQYIVTLSTTYGNMVLLLFPIDAPQTVNSFVFLIRNKFYDDTIFHRVVPNFVVQGGDPTGTGQGGPGYNIPDEISSRKHVAGALSMANAGPNTNGSQFFICYGSQPSLDGHYSVFGQLTQGMDILNKIKQGDRLIKAAVEEK